jgi:two-component system, sensor histidine kinase
MLQNYSIRKKLNFVVLSFTAVSVTITAIAIAALAIVSTVRAYVSGEGLWSKGLNQSFYHLSRYATTQDPREYDQFLKAIKIPVAGNNGLIELEKPNPDLDKVDRYMIEGQNQPDDVRFMGYLFLIAHNFPHVSDAVRIWHIGDEYCHRLQSMGKLYSEKMQNHQYLPTDQAKFIADLDTLNDSANSLEAQFSAAFGEAAHWLLNILYFFIPFAAFFVTCIGVLMSRSISNSVSSGVEVLHAATKRLAEGDLDYKIAVESNDELGNLAQSYNDMSSALVESQQQLYQSQKMVALGEAAQEVAKEIDTPLAVIKLSLHILKGLTTQQPLDAPKIKEKMDTISQALERMSKTVFGLVSLSRDKQKTRRSA